MCTYLYGSREISVCSIAISLITTRHQTMIFNFKEHPDLMMDKVVEIRVLNTRKLLKDALIGSFKVCAIRVCVTM